MDGQRIRLLRSLAAAGVRYVPRAAAGPAPGRAPQGEAPPATAESAPRAIVNASQASLFAARRASDPEHELAAVATGVGRCTACRLATTRTKAVPGEGDPHARVVFVGEGPGADEDRTGRPFVGRAGQLLDDIIAKGMKLRREEVYICNVVKCRPPENRVPAPDEVEACADWLDRQLLAIAPRVICALGSTAARRLLATERSLGALRGTTHRWRDIPLIVTYHPAYLLRNPAAKAPTWADIQRVMELMNGP
ncbi:MAG TPA: uracil-DNA glycosylase [Planctomycetota bacterium]|nr:uracil-DNA glycosylase [Planctomycetota bacterium]